MLAPTLIIISMIHITVELHMQRCTIVSTLTCLFISTLITVSLIQIKRLKKDNNLNHVVHNIYGRVVYKLELFGFQVLVYKL